MNYSNRNGGICILLFLFLLPFAAAQHGNQNESYYNKFSPSMAIIIVILIAALFLMGFFSIYIRHCSGSPSASIRNLPAASGRSRRGSRGLDQAVIDTFPTLEYSTVNIHKLGKGTLECAVCLNEFEDTETLRLIPKCDHVFHPECIDEWLASHTTCPVCRANLVPQPGDSVHGIPILDAPQGIEAQQQQDPKAEPQVLTLNQTLNRNRTRGSQSGRPRRFPRSHSTGHSLVQPGEDTERFTLRLPQKVRKQILQKPELHRARSLVILPREGSSRRGYRTGEGSSRGRSSRRLDRWVFSMAPAFFVRASSIRSPRVANNGADGTSATAPLPPAVESV
ncbi:hypothetical protein AAZX31_20G218100 [Glycine max]|uniref:RING-type E3 ubiquitin transferase n=1 Tax=Glycine max TaxID=3847 RepID=K7N574_SOYBN|nr:E3 ubiquitin-protein ligase ATL6 [Glycine max]KAH1192104.1 E3 ubiquitin-protein ligase ATL6 [Glycine max]KRG92822.1 hypothetical protein GLYMA_20G231900v4 [Glycine max]|eukprot:XP_003555593.1 E3 ubiquitin-protein ligase ATL6 [Glycine max]